MTGKGYSDNIVGFQLLDVPTGKSLLSNPLVKGENALATLLPDGPPKLSVSTWDSGSGSWKASTFGDAWSDVGLVVAPGQAAMFDNQTGAALTLQFTGSVAQGSLSSSLPSGESYHAATLPIAGGLATDFGFPGGERSASRAA